MVNVARLAERFHWTPQQVLEAPAPLLKDVIRYLDYRAKVDQKT